MPRECSGRRRKPWLRRVTINNATLAPHEQDGSTPLMYAAANGRAGAVQVLLAAGADKEARNNVGAAVPPFAADRSSYGQAAAAHPGKASPQHTRTRANSLRLSCAGWVDADALGGARWLRVRCHPAAKGGRERRSEEQGASTTLRPRA